ncbi:condensation domain protein [Mycobacterium xenopi 3993]|nr:condensation domain protein [Mycobacterium xenopi 3993]
MVSALWVTSTSQLVLMIHHLAVDGVSWRILLEDINIAWAQHRSGQQILLPITGTSFARWPHCWPSTRAIQKWLNKRRCGGRSSRCLRCSQRSAPKWIRLKAPGACRCR